MAYSLVFMCGTRGSGFPLEDSYQVCQHRPEMLFFLRCPEDLKKKKFLMVILKSDVLVLKNVFFMISEMYSWIELAGWTGCSQMFSWSGTINWLCSLTYICHRIKSTGNLLNMVVALYINNSVCVCETFVYICKCMWAVEIRDSSPSKSNICVMALSLTEYSNW